MAYSYIRRRRYVLAGRGYIDTPGTDHIGTTGVEAYAWVDSVDKSANLADWKRRIALVQSATTSLTGERKDATMQGGFYSFTIQDKASKVRTETYRYGLMGYVPAFPTASSLSETTANNQALVRFVKRANAVTNHFQGGVAIGELAETLRMIRNPAKAFRGGLDDYLENVKKRTRSRRNVRGGPISNSEKRKIIADTWLEHAFGWAPLINDAKSAAETLARRRHEWRRETSYVRAGGSNTTSSCTVPSQSLYGYLVSYAQSRTVSDVAIRYYGVVKREVYNDYDFDLKLFGFSPDKFLPTAWELIPYSFLVDYFTNIGDIINSYAFNRSSLAWINKGIKKRAKLTTSFWLDWEYARDKYVGSMVKTWLGYSRSDPKLVLEHITVNRTAYGGSLVPTIEFTIPGLGLKWINLSALAAGHAEARRAISRLG